MSLCPHTCQDRGGRVPSPTRSTHTPEHPPGRAGGCTAPGVPCPGAMGALPSPVWPVRHAVTDVTPGAGTARLARPPGAGTAVGAGQPLKGFGTGWPEWSRPGWQTPAQAQARPHSHTTGWDWGLGALGGPGAAPRGGHPPTRAGAGLVWGVHAHRVFLAQEGVNLGGGTLLGNTGRKKGKCGWGASLGGSRREGMQW